MGRIHATWRPALQQSPLRSNQRVRKGTLPIPMVIVREESQTGVPHGAWVIENAYVSVRVVPDLAGRVAQIEHRATKIGVLAESDPVQGCRLRAPQRAMPVDPVVGAADAAADVPEEPSDAGRVVVAGLLPGTPFGVQIEWSVDPERADLGVDIALRNRSLEAIEPCWSALALTLGAGATGSTNAQGVWVAVDHEGVGVAVFADPHRVRAAQLRDGTLEVGRSHAPRPLLPRRAEVWTCRVLPLVGLRTPVAAGDGCVLGLVGQTAYVVCAHALMGRLFVLDADGNTLEATLELQPGGVEAYELPTVPKALSVRDAGGTTLLHWTPDTGFAPLGRASGEPVTLQTYDDVHGVAYRRAADQRAAGLDPSAALAEAADAPEWEALAHLQGAMHALAAGDTATAEGCLDSALATNAEDPLLWWLRAVTDRHAESDGDASPNLPNAHFLAPLEPALRAEAFLAQPANFEGGPNPLLAPLAANPDNAVEAASLLVDVGLWADAARLMDELLRHAELSALRALLAYSHLQATGMRAEAAEHVSRLVPFVGPAPWRPVETRAWAALRAAFPELMQGA